MFRGLDLSSDTVTRPSLAMKKAMCEAELGDEQKGEDPTTLYLEKTMAELTGHSSAMFLPSAAMSNQIAIRLHCQPGDELIADENCHLFFAEAGGPAVHSGVQAKAIMTENGIFSGEQVHAAYRWPQGPHYPVSKLLSVENTSNMGGGAVWSRVQLDSVLSAAQDLRLKTHMDGARIFNASVASGMSVKEIAKGFDSVTICFSKGLSCPTGAVLVFDKEHWPKVRRLKQLFGGAMRQSGMLAAACLYALEHNVSRLHEDHRHAQDFARGLRELPFIEVETPEPASNMVFFRWIAQSLSPSEFLTVCLAKGLRFSQVGAQRFRAVTHADISTQNLDEALFILREICSRL